MKTIKTILSIFLLPLLLIFNGCGETPSSSGSNGAISLNLMDASTDDYHAVYVTIDEIKAHREDGDGWITVATPHPQKTYNLLELINGIMETLDITDIEPGRYTQLRLYLGDEPDNELNILGISHDFANYVIDKNDEIHELKIPSAYKSGVKLVREFEIVAGLTVDLVLDFDACASIVKAGKSGQLLLKPTIKVIDIVNNAIVSGIVSDVQQNGLEGARVSAQISDQSALDEKDSVSVYTSTITTGDEEDHNPGEYLLYLPPGTYDMVAYKPGFVPECIHLTTEIDDVLTENFKLEEAVSGTVFGTVTIDKPSEGQSVQISFRQSCGDEFIEIASLNVTNDTDYEIQLPEGDYLVVASTDGMDTFETSINIEEAQPMELDIDFAKTPAPTLPF
jgi:hypothetical protein